MEKGNKVKINFSFKVRDFVWGKGELSPGDETRQFGAKIRKAMEESARMDLPEFTCRVIFSDADYLEGQVQSNSMVHASTEQAMLEVLRQLLQDETGADKVEADINLNCFF